MNGVDYSYIDIEVYIIVYLYTTLLIIYNY